MTVRITRVLTFAEYVDLGDDAVARGFYRNDKRIFTPGMAWYQPFYFDPLGELAAWIEAHPNEKRYHPYAMIESRDSPNASFLSIHYWRDWADKRPPIAVVGPNGEEWGIDRKSSNGDGWRVTGMLPNITCEPSIVLTGYHGYLRNGEFTPNL